MQQTMVVVLATFAVQAVGALLSGAIFLGFSRHYQRGYLLHWTRSWFALAVHLIYGGLALALSQTLPVASPAVIGVSLLAAVAGYVQVAWLLFGTWELAKGQPVPRAQARALVTGFSILGALTALVYAWEPGADFARLVMRVGVRSSVLAAVFLTTAVVVWRTRMRERAFGQRLVAGAFLLYGLEKLHLIVASGGAALGYAQFAYVSWLGLVDVLLQFVMTLGLVTWLLEDERKATADASAQIEHLAFHDTLTALPNRQLLLDRLERAIKGAKRHGKQVAVLFVDLDRFKVINDSLGHTAGDHLLRSMGERMVELLRENDTVARVGGDEFVIVAPDIAGADDAVIIARRVLAKLKAPLELDGRDLFTSASIGISLFPNDGADAETLVKHADVAMYRAKSQGRDTFELFTAEMNARALEQLALETALRRAVVNDEFEIHYQPIHHFSDDAGLHVDAVEALVRWRHPELGMLPPDKFIPIAETTGLIVEMGIIVLRRACADIARLRATSAPWLRLACNVSVRQLQTPEFIAAIGPILEQTGLPADALELEITESMAMKQAEESRERLRTLKRLGLRISIDDFGTGYSSLSALRLLPVDTLKIDRSFVSGVISANGAGNGDTAIANAVIALAHSLGLTVVAEGVETDRQLQFLREQRCDAWQGFLACRPVPLERLKEYLAGSTPRSVPVVPLRPRAAAGGER